MTYKKSAARSAGLLSKDFKRFCDKKLEPYGLTNGLYLYLLAVYHQPGVTMTQIREYSQEDKAYTTRMIKTLETQGLIARTKNDKDGRSWNLNLTEEGGKIMDVLYDLSKEWNQLLVTRLGQEKAKLLTELLDEASEAMITK